MNIDDELTHEALHLDKMIVDFKMKYQEGKKDMQLFDRILMTKGWIEKQCLIKSLNLVDIIGKHTLPEYNELLNDLAKERAGM